MSYRRNARRRAIHTGRSPRPVRNLEAANRWATFWFKTKPARDRRRNLTVLAAAEKRDGDSRVQRGLYPRPDWWRRLRGAAR